MSQKRIGYMKQKNGFKKQKILIDQLIKDTKDDNTLSQVYNQSKSAELSSLKYHFQAFNKNRIIQDRFIFKCIYSFTESIQSLRIFNMTLTGFKRSKIKGQIQEKFLELQESIRQLRVDFFMNKSGKPDFLKNTLPSSHQLTVIAEEFFPHFERMNRIFVKSVLTSFEKNNFIHFFTEIRIYKQFLRRFKEQNHERDQNCTIVNIETLFDRLNENAIQQLDQKLQKVVEVFGKFFTLIKAFNSQIAVLNKQKKLEVIQENQLESKFKFKRKVHLSYHPMHIKITNQKVVNEKCYDLHLLTYGQELKLSKNRHSNFYSRSGSVLLSGKKMKEAESLLNLDLVSTDASQKKSNHQKEQIYFDNLRKINNIYNQVKTPKPKRIKTYTFSFQQKIDNKKNAHMQMNSFGKHIEQSLIMMVIPSYYMLIFQEKIIQEAKQKLPDIDGIKYNIVQFQRLKKKNYCNILKEFYRSYSNKVSFQGSLREILKQQRDKEKRKGIKRYRSQTLNSRLRKHNSLRLKKRKVGKIKLVSSETPRSQQSSKKHFGNRLKILTPVQENRRQKLLHKKRKSIKRQRKRTRLKLTTCPNRSKNLVVTEIINPNKGIKKECKMLQQRINKYIQINF